VVTMVMVTMVTMFNILLYVEQFMLGIYFVSSNHGNWAR